MTEASQLKTASQAATAAANGAASNAGAAANIALQIANSVAQGSAGSSDMAKQKQQIADLYGKLAEVTYGAGAGSIDTVCTVLRDTVAGLVESAS